MNDIFYIILWTLILTGVSGEVRFVCPRPTTPKSDMLRGSCSRGNFEKEFTEVWPGLLTIEYEEPIVRKGAVVRVELIDLESFSESCFLLDHIPHNDGLKAPTHPNCQVDQYPLGKCDTSSFITIKIPDIKCNKCALKLTQFLMPNKDVDHCEEVDCIKYHSCANIRIHPRTPGKTITNCTRMYVDSVRSKWALYGPIIYRPSRETDSRFPVDYFLMVDYWAEDKIIYDVNIPETEVEVRNIILLRHKKATTAMAKLKSSFDKPQHFIGTLPKKKYKNFRRAYELDGPVMRISYIDMKTERQHFYYTSQLVKQSVQSYERRTINYSPSGWVRDMRYVGTEANYTDVVYPAGQCAPPYGQYGVSLLNDTKEPSGVISYLKNDVVHITGLFPRENVEWNLTLDSNDIDTLSKNFNKENTFWGNIKPKISPKSFVINGNDSSTLRGTSYKALQAVVHHYGQRYGLALLSLVGTEQYRVHYFLKNVKGRTPSPTEIVLTYPTPSNVTHNITHGLVHMHTHNFMFGGWTTIALFNGTGDEFFIRSGFYGIRSITDNEARYTFTATFEVPQADFCNGVKHVFCNVIHLKWYNSYSESRANPHGVMSVKEEPSGAMTIRMYIRDMEYNEKVDAAFFYSGRPNAPETRQHIDMAFVYPVNERKTATLTTATLLNDRMKKLWKDGQLYIAVRLTTGTILSTEEPPVTTPGPLPSGQSSFPAVRRTKPGSKETRRPLAPGETRPTAPGDTRPTAPGDTRPTAPDIRTRAGAVGRGDETTVQSTTAAGVTVAICSALYILSVVTATIHRVL